MKKIILLAVVLGLAVVVMGLGAAVGWWQTQLKAVNVEQTELTAFTVESGQTLTQVAAQLETQGLIRSGLALRFYERFFAEAKVLQAGVYNLSPSQTLPEVYEALHQVPEEITITILPGWRREEIGEYLDSLGLQEFNREEFLDLTADLEGNLMPETYRVAPLSTATTIVNILSQQFTADVMENQELQAQIRNSGKSFEQILIIASLLQREARDFEQMRMIAGILDNRLDDDYPLQLCASAQYATGKDPQSGSWWLAPSLLDTQIDSPYNTYNQAGLPPGPICAVSLSALEAAASPQANDYYFYLHDDRGVIHYGVTGEDHQQNIADYLQ